MDKKVVSNQSRNKPMSDAYPVMVYGASGYTGSRIASPIGALEAYGYASMTEGELR